MASGERVTGRSCLGKGRGGILLETKGGNCPGGVQHSIWSNSTTAFIPFPVFKSATRAIARQKLLDAFGQEYCEENGLTFTKVNPPAEMVEAREAYVDELMTKAAGEITYYTD